MAERVEFTKEMKDAGYTILVPDMLNTHFKLVIRAFEHYGYHMEMLTNRGQSVVDEGLKYTHNDTCYPALLCIGQFIDALNSGKYDVNKTALMMIQTGGGCRASNYIHLIRKALEKAGYPAMPVISLNFAGLEKNSGFKITLPMIRQGLACVTYGDLLMLLENQVKPYETKKGSAVALTEIWIDALSERFCKGQSMSGRQMEETFDVIARSYADVPVNRVPKVKTAIVGEIYVKYAPLGNNNLEAFLASQDCEVMVPGLVDFAQYYVQTLLDKYDMYGGNPVVHQGTLLIGGYLKKLKERMDTIVKKYGFITSAPFERIKHYVDGIIGRGCTMGEGWLLTAEMVELSELGYENIVCVQPFGCLPNHVMGKGMMRKVKERCPNANIVAIDYDPGTTQVNQENRIKLMLAVAREKLEKKLAEAAVETAGEEVFA